MVLSTHRDSLKPASSLTARLSGYAASIAVELARFSLGRVLLHLIAALGDGAVRFHAAGIRRELVRVGEATAQLLFHTEEAGLRSGK
jgi:hypothetical protein